ncbi:MAG: hypothetical protein R3B72_34255 [Polyangiaceae bacterium]
MRFEVLGEGSRVLHRAEGNALGHAPDPTSRYCRIRMVPLPPDPHGRICMVGSAWSPRMVAAPSPCRCFASGGFDGSLVG